MRHRRSMIGHELRQRLAILSRHINVRSENTTHSPVSGISDKVEDRLARIVGPQQAELLEPRVLLSGTHTLLITEMLARNDSIIADEDGQFSDYIEIYNPGLSTVNLDGWSLTDNADSLDKWTFPAVSLDPGEFLVVFASNKNRTNPASELHTNFKLDGDGEYLALVEGDGSTIAHEYSPNFPNQPEDVSYGLSFEGESLIDPEATTQYLVPTDNSLRTNWTQPGFTPGPEWKSGAMGIGFGLQGAASTHISTDISSDMDGVNSSAYMRLPFNVSNPAAFNSLELDLTYDDGYAAYLNGTLVASKNVPGTLAFDSAATQSIEVPVTITEADFDSPDTLSTITQHVAGVAATTLENGPTGDYLRLVHDGANNSQNGIAFDRVFEGAAQRITADFDYRAFSNNGAPADGFAFILLPTQGQFGVGGPGTTGAIQVEQQGLAGALTVGFDVHPAPGTNTVNLTWNGSIIQSSLISTGTFDIDDGQWHHVNIDVEAVDGGANVTVTIVPNVHGAPGTPFVVPDMDSRFVPGFTPYESRVEFGGRTGGLNMTVDLDNINVAYQASAAAVPTDTIDLTGDLGLLQTGSNVLAIHGLNVSDTDSDFVIDASLRAGGGELVQVDKERFFTTPTPGAVNDSGEPAPSLAPTISIGSQTFEGSFQVEIDGPSNDAEVYYTTNGSLPTLNSTLYAGPITITSTTQLRARAIEPGFSLSEAVSEVYIQRNTNVNDFSSDLPVIVLETFGQVTNNIQAVPQNGQMFAQWMMFEPDEVTGRTTLNSEPTLSTRAGFKIRGSSSAGRPKPSFTIEAWDQVNDDKDIMPLGMPEESDWILYAAYNFDLAMLRNTFAYELSNQVGRYAVRTRFVELYVNRSDNGAQLHDNDYMGVYVLMEKIKVGDDRVDITKLEPQDNAEPDVNGGYALKIDRADPGDAGFGAGGQTIRFVDPKEEEVTPQQRSYISGFINDMAASLNDPSPATGYPQFIDEMSWVDHHILNVITMNVDALRLSTYFYKDRGGKLEFGPIWDFDRSMESTDGRDNNPRSWRGTGDATDFFNYPWWNQLFDAPTGGGPNFSATEFGQLWADRWGELREGVLSNENLEAIVDSQAAEIREAQVRNYMRWSNLNPRGGWENELNIMKNWLTDRADWIDDQILDAPSIDNAGGAISGPTPVNLTAPAGTIYYTTNGTDPRGQIGGQEVISTTELVDRDDAKTWIVPSNGNDGTNWTLVGFNDGSWNSGDEGGIGYDDNPTYDTFIGTGLDVTAAMDGVSTSAYMRIPFTVSAGSLNGINQMTLKMQADDGFVAYLNGVEIARLNAPGSVNSPPAFNAAANGNNPDGTAVSFVTHNVTSFISELQEGNNILAIHGLNDGLGSSDFLSNAELEIAEILEIGDEGLSPDAIEYTGTLTINQNVNLVARAFDGLNWSPPIRADFYEDNLENVVISEINYHPQDPTADELLIDATFEDGDFEFVELHNPTDEVIELSGLQFTNGIRFELKGVQAETLLGTNFGTNAGGFVYSDDPFTGTNNPGFADGVLDANAGNGGDPAVLFDGTDDRILVGNKAELNFDDSDAFSISAWIKTDTPNRDIISKMELGTDDLKGWRLGLNADGQVEFRFISDADFEPVAGLLFPRVIHVAADTTSLADGQFHHVVMTYSGAGNSASVGFFVDGVAIGNFIIPTGNISITGQDPTSSEPVLIGAYGTTRHFDGVIDELAVLNGIVSSQEASRLFTDITSGDNYTTRILGLDPIAYWKLSENPGATTAADETGNHDGTYENFAGSAFGQPGVVSDGALTIDLGPGDTGGPTSGGWSQTFDLLNNETVELEFDYRMVLGEGFEANEFAQFIVEIDGVRLGGDVDGSVLQVSGNGDGGGADDTGWLSAQFSTALSAGTHTLTIGIFNNQADSPDESVQAFIDNLSLQTLPNSPRLQPGESAVVVANASAFGARYGLGTAAILGEFEGSLDNGGEQIVLSFGANTPLIDFEYDDDGSWPGRSDGSGSTLELVDVNGIPAAGIARTDHLETSGNWRSSSEYGGTPGSLGIGARRDVVVNEVLPHTDLPSLDTIELHNTTGAPIDISGWFLSDSKNDYRKFEIPSGTIVPAGGYILFDESDFNSSGGVDPKDFALNGAHGDDVWLLEADGSGNLLSFVDHIEFDAAANGESIGRWPNATGILYPQASTSLGSANTGPRIGPLIISEIHYHPQAPTAQELAIDPSLETSDFEFVEIYNPLGVAVDLTDWRIRGGVDYDFDDGQMIQAGQALTIIKFNPTNPENTNRLTAFRTRYGIDAATPLLGGYSGQLDNGGERVTLQRPDAPPLDEPDFIPRLIEDRVIYDDVSPWPESADGTGDSISRVASNSFGSFGSSWDGEVPTPGTATFGGGGTPEVDVHLVPRLVPTNGDTSGVLPFEDSPGPDFWVREGRMFNLEIWVKVDQAFDTFTGGSVRVTYDSSVVQPVSVDHGGVFDGANPVETIDLGSSFVELGGDVSQAGLGATEFVKLGTILFTGKGDIDPTLSEFGPFSMGFVPDAGPSPFMLAGNGPSGTDIKPAPDATVRAVPYDFDNNDVVNFADLGFFLGALGETPGGSQPPFSDWADFNGDNIVDGDDQDLIVNAFGKSITDPTLVIDNDAPTEGVGDGGGGSIAALLAAALLDPVDTIGGADGLNEDDEEEAVTADGDGGVNVLAEAEGIGV